MSIMYSSRPNIQNQRNGYEIYEKNIKPDYLEDSSWVSRVLDNLVEG